MRKTISRIARRDEGLTTVEYGVVTVAAAGLGGVLLKLLTSDLVRDLLWSIIKSVLSMFGM